MATLWNDKNDGGDRESWIRIAIQFARRGMDIGGMDAREFDETRWSSGCFQNHLLDRALRDSCPLQYLQCLAPRGIDQLDVQTRPGG